MTPPVDGPWTWAEKAAEVLRCARKKMSPEDQVILDELFARENAGRWNEMIATNRAVWDRYRTAFDLAVREVPAPYPMTVFDRGW
jgi:hypothetical protein